MNKLSEKDRILHQQFSEYGKNAREWMRKCVLLLPEIEKNRIWEKKGFGSIYEYVAKLAGMSHEIVNNSLRVLKKVEDKPMLKKIIEEKGINIVRPIINLVNNSNERFWAEKATSMSQHTLEAYAKAIREEDGRRATSEKISVNMELEPEIFNKIQKLKGNRDWNEIIKQLLEIREKQLEAEKPETITSTKGYVPANLQKYINKKTNGQCSFANCLKKTEFLHHRDRFAINHRHNPENIVGLCKAHHDLCHQSLVNEYSWTILKEPDKTQPSYVVDRKMLAYRR